MPIDSRKMSISDIVAAVMLLGSIAVAMLSGYNQLRDTKAEVVELRNAINKLQQNSDTTGQKAIRKLHDLDTDFRIFKKYICTEVKKCNE